MGYRLCHPTLHGHFWARLFHRLNASLVEQSANLKAYHWRKSTQW